jgi:hypothetical protein
MRTVQALALSILFMTACGSKGTTRTGFSSPLPNVHVSVQLQGDPSMPSGCCRLISSSDAKTWVYAFCQLVVYGPDGKVKLNQPLWPAPAGLSIQPGLRREAGKAPLPVDPIHGRFLVSCQAIEWHGLVPV